MKIFFLPLALAGEMACKVAEWIAHPPPLPLGGNDTVQLLIFFISGYLADELCSRLGLDKVLTHLGHALHYLYLKLLGRNPAWIESANYRGPDRRRNLVDRRGGKTGGRRCTDLRCAS